MKEETSQKEVQLSRYSRKLYLSVYMCIKDGLTPADISKKFNISKQKVSYHIKRLKASGAISKIGYGVWKANDLDQKEVKHLATRPPPPFIIARSPKKEVRGHGFRFLVRLPKLERWSGRRGWMQKKGVEFKRIPHGESIEVRGHRVKLYRRSMDIYFSKEWSLYAVTAEVSWKYALLELKSVLTAFQNLFHIDLGMKVEWRVCRQHYALVRNALAKDFLSKKEKLQVFDAEGKLWMMIDNSLNLEELETVHTQSAKDDNKIVQDDFNALKERGLSRDFLAQAIDSLIKDRIYADTQLKEYAVNIKTHIEAIKKLGDGVEKLTKKISRED